MPVQTIWRRLGGSEYERRWWGPSDAVRALQSFAASTGASEVTVTQSPGSSIAILSARYQGVLSGQETAVETMAIKFSDETVPIHRNPTFIGISDARIAALDKAAQDQNTGVPSQDDGGIEFEYYDCKSRGEDSYICKLPHVVWNRSVSENFSTAIDISGVGKVLSTSRMVAALGAPVLFSIPTGNVGVRESSGWTAGWLVDAEVDYTSDGKLSLMIKGDFGLYRNSLYTIVS